MDFLTIVLIGIGLAMDCFAVALARGSKPGVDKIRLALVFAVVFGLFQAGMTLLGWGAGTLFMGIIAPYDHWVAFIILSAIGLKMIIEGMKDEPEKFRNRPASGRLPPFFSSRSRQAWMRWQSDWALRSWIPA